MRSAAACRWARPADSPCSNARTGQPACNCAATVNPATRTTCRRRIPKASARNWRWDALARAGIDAGEVGYLNLHGTATPANDKVEAIAVSALFPDTLHASSTKGWTGHTLGAAGIVESVFALLALEHGVLPGTLNSHERDAACGAQIRLDNAERGIGYAMNNSFGFGGNNCSLVFGAA